MKSYNVNLRKCLAAIFLCSLIHAFSIDVYVAVDGDDNASGTIDNPVASLQSALDKVSGVASGSTIWFTEGTYFFQNVVSLTSSHSGNASAPLTIKAVDGENVVFSGGTPLDGEKFSPLTDATLLARVPAAAHDAVMTYPIDASLASKFPSKDEYDKYAYIGWENHLLEMAQFPNKGYAYINDVFDKGPLRNDEYTYDEEHPAGAVFDIRERIDWGMLSKEFSRTHDMLLQGYLHNDWHFTTERIGGVDDTDETIKLLKHTTYGVDNEHISLPRRIRIMNALSQLDSPGEWYYDRIDSLFYIWPVELPNNGNAITLLSESSSGIVGSADYLTIENITFKNFYKALELDNSDHIFLGGCNFYNMSFLAVRLTGVSNGLQSCNFSNVTGSIVMGGYDSNRTSLTPENNYIVNCDFSKSLFRGYGNVVLRGVGVYFAHNLLHDMNAGMVVEDNDHIVEYNEYYNMGWEMGDWNAIYTNNDLSARGNIMRHNFFHHFFATPKAHQIFAIRTDDWGSGYHFENNILYKSGQGAAQWNGPDNSITANVMMESQYIWWTNQYPYYTADYDEQYSKTASLQTSYDEYLQLQDDIANNKESFSVKHNKIGKAEAVFGEKGWETNETWKSHYPNFANTFEFLDKDNNPWCSTHNDITKNYTKNALSLPYHVHGWNDMYTFAQIRNMIPESTDLEMPITFDYGDLFVDASKMDFRFLDSFSPVEGFEKWDFDSVGMTIDKYRTSVPDKSKYRNAIKDKYDGVASTGGTFSYDVLNERYELPDYTTIYHDNKDTQFTAQLSINTDAVEGKSPFSVQITLSQVNLTGSDIAFQLKDLKTGSAISGSDYVALPGDAKLIVPQNSNVGTYEFTVLNDSDLEYGETIDLMITRPDYAYIYIAGANTTATITDDDAYVCSFEVKTNGDEGADKDIIITASLDKDNSTGSNIDILLEDTYQGTASSGGDYVAFTPQSFVSIPNGSKSADFSLEILDDNAIEIDETLIFTAHSNGLVLIQDTSNVAHISDADVATAVLSSIDAKENSSDGVKFKVTLSGVNETVSDITFDVKDTEDGTAYAGIDYDEFSWFASINVPVGSDTGIYIVNIEDDSKSESTETIIVDISDCSSNRVTTLVSNDTAYIYDDENVAGLAKSKTTFLSIYPNPAHDLLNLNAGINLEGADLIIYNMKGGIVVSSVIHNNRVDVSRLISGVYRIVIKASGDVLSDKIVKL